MPKNMPKYFISLEILFNFALAYRPQKPGMGNVGGMQT